jgi:hypothetical protein
MNDIQLLIDALKEMHEALTVQQLTLKELIKDYDKIMRIVVNNSEMIVNNSDIIRKLVDK